ncbi:sulfatase-like hydrolase/transferase [bacterium]|jgi:arylsulfatase A-like enzyme|nr:sulfatase [Gemmatimonadota bacterium]MCH2663657.1 sulfatase-like hydrolase/transferase [bacterium]HCK11548.1 sulfatase [Candidatus Latescibacterota bacterium]
MAKRKRNLILFGIDSLWADRMSCYGYDRLTTPNIDRLASQGVLFENTYSAHIPTTSAYASMLTGMDCFSTEVVALRHQGGLTKKVKTLPEILRKEGYNTTCVGFTGNPSSRGFNRYENYAAWGSWDQRPLRKAELLNDIAIPELERLSRSKKPFCLFLRHMDPHAPYLPPAPYDTMFYGGDPCAKGNKSMDPVKAFKPFRDFHLSWMPPGITDTEYVNAQYDGEVAYMDACIQVILTKLEALGLAADTIVALNGDHGETLDEHDCYYDHHGLYECTLHVPLILRLPGVLPEGVRVSGYNQHKDLVPTLLQLMGIKPGIKLDGHSLMPMIKGQRASHESGIYITEATWMRKHGWRTPEWKLIVALEPDFHFKPEVELYNLIEDPGETKNLANKEKGIVATLRKQMEDWIAKREKETGNTNPMYTNGDWHGIQGHGPFKSSQEAYDSVHIGSAERAKQLQEGKK